MKCKTTRGAFCSKSPYPSSPLEEEGRAGFPLSGELFVFPGKNFRVKVDPEYVLQGQQLGINK